MKTVCFTQSGVKGGHGCEGHGYEEHSVDSYSEVVRLMNQTKQRQVCSHAFFCGLERAQTPAVHLKGRQKLCTGGATYVRRA